MDVDQYIAIYRVAGVSGLNDALKPLKGQHLVNLLKALELKRFQILWHTDSDVSGSHDSGVVISGPDD